MLDTLLQLNNFQKKTILHLNLMPCIHFYLQVYDIELVSVPGVGFEHEGGINLLARMS